jgi:hypothetical protein
VVAGKHVPGAVVVGRGLSSRGGQELTGLLTVAPPQVHGAPNGSRLLAAAKSCYLPPTDPRMKASFKEAELLRRCADCPFIMQLLNVIQVG